MKLINTIILLLISVLSFSQTKLDSLVLSKINSYRVSKGLNEVDFSTIGAFAKQKRACCIQPVQRKPLEQKCV